MLEFEPKKLSENPQFWCLTRQTAFFFNETSNLVQKNTLKIALIFFSSFVRHFVRHLSDTCRFFAMKTKASSVWAKCLKVSDRFKSVPVCLRGGTLGSPSDGHSDTNTRQEF